MAVGSFDQDTLEQVIATAIECGLATDDRRSQLLAHLPQRFVDKVELLDDPVAQLRADLEHLNDHPRLPDHHQPPLASWLQNAYLLTMPSEEARTFRTLRTRLVGSGRQQEILRSITRIKTITIPEAERVAKARDRARTPRAGALLGGRFSLERRLGQGAVAEVWRAQDVAAGIPVAVKILHRRWADQPLRRERFFSGARQMASFSHPHIVPVVMPEGEDAGVYYSVLEYLDAGDLESALREGRIRRSTGLRALLLVASGVAAMHSMGVMHLDVKPQNILLGSDGRVMLGDFDRVRNQAIEGGSTTDTVESIFYLAPETFDETRTPGPTADVFSLGMTALFVMHGDKLPAWIVRRPAALLRRIDCPDAVRDVIARAIEIDPAARFTDVESMAMALQEALGRPSTALPRIAPLISAAPMAIKPSRAPSAPGSGPMPRVSAPPRPHLSVGRTTDNLPPVARVTMELPEPEPEPESDVFRALSQPIDLRLDGGESGGPPSRDLPAPSIPPPSLPPPPMDLPPARTGELELEDSVDSALSVLDKAAAAALAEEFARAEDAPAPEPDPTPAPEHDPEPAALIEPLPAPVHDRATTRDQGPALIEPISGSIDLEASVIPADTSGPHASIPGDENRAPWTWIERSGGFMVAEPPESNALDVHSDRISVPPEPGDAAVDPWRWMSRPLRPMDPELPDMARPAPDPEPAPDEPAPAPAHRSARVRPAIATLAHAAAEPEAGVEPDPTPVEPAVQPEPTPDLDEPAERPLPPAPTPAGPAADGALPADLISAEYMALAAPEAPPPPEQTADDAVLPPPATFEFEAEQPDAPEAPAEPAGPVPPDRPDPPTEPYRPVAPETPDEPETVTLPLEAPRRRTALWMLGGGLAAAAVGLLAYRRWADDGGTGDGPEGRQAGTPDAAPSRAMDAGPPDTGAPDAEAPDTAAVPDASPPDQAPPDAAAPDAEADAVVPDAVVPDAVVDAAIPDAAPKPRRRRRRKPKRRRRRRKPKPKPTPKPTPKPEPLIEIPDEIQQMLDE